MAYLKTTEEITGAILMPDQLIITDIKVLDWRGSPLNIKWDTELNQTLNKGDVFKLKVTIKF